MHFPEMSIGVTVRLSRYDVNYLPDSIEADCTVAGCSAAGCQTILPYSAKSKRANPALWIF